MKLRLHAAAMALSVAAMPAVAAHAQKYEMFGVGLTGCGEIATAKTLSSTQLQWVLGYMSGLNYANGLVSSGAMSATGANLPDQYIGVVNQWIVQFCSVNGQAVLEAAATAFYAELVKEHL